MAPRRWSAEEDSILRRMWPASPLSEILRALPHRIENSIGQRARKLGVKRYAFRAPWTAEQDATLRRLYPHQGVALTAKACSHKIAATYRRAHLLGVKLTPERKRAVLQQCGQSLVQHPASIAHRIQKGNVPANKGLRRPGYSIGRGRMQETQFKKGQRSQNWKPIGSIKLIDGYRYVKISDLPEPPGQRGGSSPNWKALHFKIWEDAGNPPINIRTHVLIFKDGNRENCALENLERITRADNVRRNSLHRLPPKLKKVIYAKIALKRKITIMEREKIHGREQRKKRRHAGRAARDAVRHAAAAQVRR